MTQSYSLDKCGIIQLATVRDSRGTLTFIEGTRHVPFEIQRAYYVYDVPGGSTRGSHAHRKQREFIVAVAGSFDVILDDGTRRQRFTMNRSYFGLNICPMIWRKLENFSTGAVCLVLSSGHFDEGDYIRKYREYKAARGKSK